MRGYSVRGGRIRELESQDSGFGGSGGPRGSREFGRRGPGAYSGGSGDRDDFRQHALWLWESVQDVKTTVTDLVAEGDRVVAYWRIEGIHRGTIFGVPGTGKPFTGNSISTITFRGGKVVRYTVLPDRLGIIKQLSDEPA